MPELPQLSSCNVVERSTSCMTKSFTLQLRQPLDEVHSATHAHMFWLVPTHKHNHK